MNVAGLGRWTQLEVVEQRGDTLVLRGLDDGAPVLIKTHASELPTAACRDRLLREHAAASAAQHPHLVRLVDLVDEPNRVAVVLSWADGPTLAEAVRDGSIAAADVLAAGREAAGALAALHAAGYAHRAVDAEHLVLTPSGAVLVDLYDASPIGTRPRRSTHGVHAAPEERSAELPSVASTADQHALASTVRHALQQLGAVEEPVVRAALDRATDPHPARRHRSVLGLADALATGETPDADDHLLRLEWQDPQDLVGREALLSRLEAAVADAAEEGLALVVLVRGARGSGRTALLDALCDRLAERGVLAGLGRFGDASGVPLRGTAEVMEQTIGQLLTRPEPELDVVRRHLHELGSDLSVACQLLPDLQLLVGEQPLPAEASPEETVARVERAVPAALGALSSGAVALVGALDDVDHADATSLRTLEVIFGAEDLGPVVAVATASEVTDALQGALDHLGQRGVRIEHLELDPLDRDHVAALLAEGTGSPTTHVGELADAVWSRSGGNPQLVLADVWRLLDEGSLWVDPEARRWGWSASALAHVAPTTVDEVARARVADLDPALAELVTAVAVAGRAATASVLGGALGAAPDEVEGLLSRGVAAHVLAPPPAEDAPRAVPRGVSCLDEGIRRIALERADEAIEERVARALLASVSDADGEPAPEDQQRYELVRLMTDRPWVLADPTLRLQLVGLCEGAARSAHRAGAFREALAFQQSAIAALGEQGWDDDHARTYELHLRAAEHAVMVGDGELTDVLLQEIARHDPTPIERVRTMKTLGTQAWLSQDHGRGLDGLCETLAELGQPVPPRPRPVDLVREVAATQRALGRTPPEHFLTAERIEDPEVGAALDAMLGCVHLAYVDRPMLHILIVLRGTRLTAEHGVAAASSYFLNAYGMLQLTVPGSMGRGLRFGAVGRELARRSGGPIETMVGFAYNVFVRHWGTDLDDTVAPLLEGYETARAARERGYGLTGGTFGVLHALLAGRPLTAVDELAGRCQQELTELEEVALAQRVGIVRQSVADAREGGSVPLVGEHFDAETWLETKRRRNELAMIVHTLRAEGWRRVGDLDAARTSVRTAKALARNAPGQAVLGLHWFQQAHLDAEAVLAADGSAQVRLRAVARRSYRRLLRLAEHAPANAAHRAAFVGALHAEAGLRSNGRAAKAMERFDEAVGLATERGALGDLGLIAERAARFHLRRGSRTLARHYATLARDAWAAWGATAVADGVDRRLDGLVLGPRPATGGGDPAAATRPTETPPRPQTQAPATEETFAEATRLLGEELEVRELLERLVEILVRHADASRAFLVLETPQGPMVEVAASLEDDVVHVVPLPDPELHAHDALCTPAVQYSLRTHATLSLLDPAGDRRLRSDRSLRARSPRALLSLPIGRASGARGVLVLECDHAGHVFEPGRVEALRVLSEQAIAAIDRARLTSDLSSLADDVADLRTTAAMLAAQAETDPLTGVANRLGLEAQVDSSIRAAHAERRRAEAPDQPLRVGVLFCDLDGFKAVNDHHGHAAGDLVLGEVAERLREAVRAGDVVARVGGDEFVVVSVGVTDDELARMADRLVAELARPMESIDGPLPVTASIGVGSADLDDVTSLEDVESLLHLADEAMYQAKDAGKNRVAHS